MKLRRLIFYGLAAAVGAGAIVAGKLVYPAAVTIHELLTENRQLKKALSRLTEQEQIGYAKVVRQQRQEGRLFTTLKFVETARGNKLKKVLEKEYTIEGDVVHFDALIVKFSDEMITEGGQKSLYLWRRVYGEKLAPQEGYLIEEPGSEPKRYGDLLRALPLRERELFWSQIWQLASDPEALKEYGIEAIYGSVVYSKLRPGLIYVFKISASGQVYPEVVPDM